MPGDNRDIVEFCLYFLGVCVIGTLSSIYFLSSISPSNATADEIFEFRDRNGDGELEYSKHGLPPGMNGEPNGVLMVLDLDSSGTISREEFVDKGKMVFAKATLGQESNDQRMTLVEFKFSKEKAESGTFTNATVNAFDIDRPVFWTDTEGESPVVVEGDVAIETGLNGDLKFSSERVTFPKTYVIEKDGEIVTVKRQ